MVGLGIEFCIANAFHALINYEFRLTLAGSVVTYIGVRTGIAGVRNVTSADVEGTVSGVIGTGWLVSGIWTEAVFTVGTVIGVTVDSILREGQEG